MDRKQPVFDFLDARGIRYEWYEHPEAPTIEIARQWWRDDGSKHCKNLFFRNHKGDRHYLVCFDSERSLAIRDLEARLRQGKLTFASPERMERWLGLRPGSVSPFRADQRPGEPRPPVPRRQPARLPRLLVPPQRQPRDGGHPAGGVSEIPRRRRQLLRIHRTVLKRKTPAFRPGFFAMQGAVISSPPALCPSFRQAAPAPSASAPWEPRRPEYRCGRTSRGPTPPRWEPD